MSDQENDEIDVLKEEEKNVKYQKNKKITLQIDKRSFETHSISNLIEN